MPVTATTYFGLKAMTEQTDSIYCRLLLSHHHELSAGCTCPAPLMLTMYLRSRSLSPQSLCTRHPLSSIQRLFLLLKVTTAQRRAIPVRMLWRLKAHRFRCSACWRGGIRRAKTPCARSNSRSRCAALALVLAAANRFAFGFCVERVLPNTTLGNCDGIARRANAGDCHWPQHK